MLSDQLIETLQECNAVGDIQLSSSLVELGIDSLAIIELIVSLEQRFGFTFEEQDLVETHFKTVETLMHLLQKYVPSEPTHVE